MKIANIIFIITMGLLLGFLTKSSAAAESTVKFKEIKGELPIRKTEYMIRVPENWNGVLINDFDYIKGADSVKSMYLLDHGYALSGTKRRKGRFQNYDPAHEIHDFITIFDIFEESFGKAKTIIQMGCSGGGTVTLGMAEIHPDRIDGAIAMCASTSHWLANTHLDGMFVLKALIAPDLPIADLGAYSREELDALGKKWIKAIDDAQQTPEGRARIALAITIGQWPAWGGKGQAPVEKPDPTDIEALQNSMYQSIVRLVPMKGTGGTTMLELAAPGQLKSNVGVDYKESYNNGAKLYKKAVEALYENANGSLESDLAKINAFERVAADPEAIKWWSAPGRTHIGKPKVPMLRMNTAGDGLVYASLIQGYEDLVVKNGYSDFFRTAYVNNWGHCTFSLAELVTSIEVVLERIDSGKWPDTSAAALNKRGKSIAPQSKVNFFKYTGVQKYNRAWVPSAKDFLGSFQ
ncbi:S9 family peptidase [Paraglaciecola sp. L3A3]|uniref:alpha/beta hydrolase family protein n=1 Tax=Paraglaciecola sp. L3A3 TaxID=2686358 RepID=UPI00131CF997|nr:alpha/beta hydrolase [Paraglaciecola sp. L3A3]